MAVRVMDGSDFKSIKIGDKVAFYKNPLEHPHLFPNLRELKKYTVKDKCYDDPRGPTLNYPPLKWRGFTA
jgi:hypothetical protein